MRTVPTMLIALLFLCGCTVLDVRSDGPITGRKGWVLLPVQNLGEAPMAGERVEELLVTLMRTESNVELASFAPSQVGPGSGDASLDLDERGRYDRAVTWARQQKFAYGIGGSVQEWRYRSASEGEAAVGLTIHVVDLSTGKVIFTASGSRSGWGRDTVSGTGQGLVRSILSRLKID